MDKFFAIIFGVALSITIFFSSFEMISFDESNFKKSYIEYDVVSTTDLDINELMEITGELLTNLKGNKNQSYLKKYFNEKEMLHLEDVRHLFKIGFTIKYISLTLLLISFFYLIFKIPNKIRKIVNYTVLVTFVGLGVLVILISADFNKYFTYFHLLLFNNKLWLLDPHTDLMIQMMPEPFFTSFFKKITLLFFGFMSTIVIVVNISKVRLNGKDGKRFFNQI